MSLKSKLIILLVISLLLSSCTANTNIKDNPKAIVEIEYNSDYGTVSGSGEYEIGEEVELTATPKDGCKFVGWMENGKKISSDENFEITVRNNRNLLADFKEIEYSVNIFMNFDDAGDVSGSGSY